MVFSRRARLVSGLSAAALFLILLGGLVGKGCEALYGNTGLRFYGRTVDANGAAMPGVVVRFQVLYSTHPSVPFAMYGDSENIKKLEVTSDANGDFELPRISGYSLSITGFFRYGGILDDAFGPRNPATPRYTFNLRGSIAPAIPGRPSKRLSYPLKPK